MKKKKTIWLCLCLIILSTVSGCSFGTLTGDEKEESVGNLSSSQIIGYYLNHDETKLVQRKLTLNSKDSLSKVKEAVKKIRSVETNLEYQTPFTKGLIVDKILLDKNQVYVYFNKEYDQLSDVREVLLRAAIVRTIIQIEGVDCVSFYVKDLPLVDHLGKMVGVMTKDSFVDNIGAQINNIISTKIMLYYATEDGKNLVPVESKIYSSSNVSREKMVLEHLLDGEKQEGLVKAVPESTKLLSVATMDGICFVNLDSGFLKYNYDISESVVIYSIVNTLCELPTVNKVQISVNGETKMKYRDKMRLDEVYGRNLDMVIDSQKYKAILQEKKDD